MPGISEFTDKEAPDLEQTSKAWIFAAHSPAARHAEGNSGDIREAIMATSKNMLENFMQGI